MTEILRKGWMQALEGPNCLVGDQKGMMMDIALAFYKDLFKRKTN
jgi:hypothetical protein